MKNKTFLMCSLMLSMLIAVSSCYAMEGGVGKPIIGMQVIQYGAIVPPQPGWVFNVNELFYSGSLGGNVQVPIAGQLALDVDADIAFTMFRITKIWKTDTKRWNFASTAVLAITNSDITANVILGNISGSREDEIFSQFDLLFVPVTASYHISPLEHIAFNITIWAPTGDYEVGRLANNGMNVWSFIPTVMYTKIWPQSGLSFDANYGIEFDTKNQDTDYQNGALSYLDLLLEKKYKNGFAIGGVFGWLQQYSGDEGGLADRLNGFKSHGLGLGANIGYSTLIGKETQLSLNWPILERI